MARGKNPNSPVRVSANPSPGEGPRTTSHVEPSTCGVGNISSAPEVNEPIGKKPYTVCNSL